MNTSVAGCILRPAQPAEAANAARRLCGEPSAAPALEGGVRQHDAVTI
jgi:hypothetical protein